MPQIQSLTHTRLRDLEARLDAQRLECEAIADSRDRAEAMFRSLEEDHERLLRQQRLFCDLLDRATAVMSTIADEAPDEDRQRLHGEWIGLGIAQKLAGSHLRGDQ
jgi:hypothetical protein